MVKAYNLSVSAPVGRWDVPCANYETMKQEIEKIANKLLEDNKISATDVDVILSDFNENVSQAINDDNFKSVKYCSKLIKSNVISIIIYDISKNYI